MPTYKELLQLNKGSRKQKQTEEHHQEQQIKHGKKT